MAETDKIRSMLDNLINNNAEDAQIDFHNYLQGKMKDVTKIVSTDADKPAPDVTED